MLLLYAISIHRVFFSDDIHFHAVHTGIRLGLRPPDQSRARLPPLIAQRLSFRAGVVLRGRTRGNRYSFQRPRVPRSRRSNFDFVGSSCHAVEDRRDWLHRYFKLYASLSWRSSPSTSVSGTCTSVKMKANVPNYSPTYHARCFLAKSPFPAPAFQPSRIRHGTTTVLRDTQRRGPYLRSSRESSSIPLEKIPTVSTLTLTTCTGVVFARESGSEVNDASEPRGLREINSLHVRVWRRKISIYRFNP